MPQDLHAMVAEYRAGLEAEIALLRQLDSLSERQHEASVTGDYAMLRRVHDARDVDLGTAGSRTGAACRRQRHGKG